MGYCSRLGLWKREADEELRDEDAEGSEPFDTFLQFLQSIRGNNVMAMMEAAAAGASRAFPF